MHAAQQEGSACDMTGGQCRSPQNEGMGGALAYIGSDVAVESELSAHEASHQGGIGTRGYAIESII
jgi:hypothetical protein